MRHEDVGVGRRPQPIHDAVGKPMIKRDQRAPVRNDIDLDTGQSGDLSHPGTRRIHNDIAFDTAGFTSQRVADFHGGYLAVLLFNTSHFGIIHHPAAVTLRRQHVLTTQTETVDRRIGNLVHCRRPLAKMRLQLVRLRQVDRFDRNPRRLAGHHPFCFVGRVVFRQPDKIAGRRLHTVPADFAQHRIFHGALPRRLRIFYRITSAAVQQPVKPRTRPISQIALFQQNRSYPTHRQIAQDADAGSAAADNHRRSFFHRFPSPTSARQKIIAPTRFVHNT